MGNTQDRKNVRMFLLENYHCLIFQYRLITHVLKTDDIDIHIAIK